MRKYFSFDHIAPWMAIAFGLWIYAFWGFLSSQLVLVEDAISYYDHTKYFIDSLLGGVFPLWDPAWYHGAPNDFFLQRIGAYNPFYLLIVLFRLLGVPHNVAYLSFLAIYYFLGMILFYLLAMRIYKNQFIAFAGFFLLLFSALGTRLFDSYMMLVTVPIIGFFYFLVAFTQTPSRGMFLGMVLSVVILLTTYIPFYFLMFLAVFLVCWVLIFPDQLRWVLAQYGGFWGKNRRLVIACGALVILALLPLAIFYYQSAQGTIALPGRHGNVVDTHVLTVPVETLKWGTLEDILYSSYFSDLYRYKFAILYVPFVAFIVLLLGAWGRINRRFLFIFACALVLLCVIIPKGLPFHDFLYDHLFFMKYFRNLHFFLWFVLIPLFVLLVLEALKAFLDFKPSSPKQRWFLFVYTQVMHLVAFIFVWWRDDAVLSTWVTIALSAVFFGGLVLGKLTHRGALLAGIILVVVIQPLEVYHHLARKGLVYRGGYQYDQVKSDFNFADKSALTSRQDYPKEKAGLYYASKAYNDFHAQADNYDLRMYLRHKLILMDQMPQMEGVNPSVGQGTVLIKGNSPLLKVLSFSANHLMLHTNLPTDKFLVYNDSYDPRWKVFINGREVKLYKVNGAFKGAWIPPGKAVVEFRFGSWWIYALHVGLLLSFCLVLAGCLYDLCLNARKGVKGAVAA